VCINLEEKAQEEAQKNPLAYEFLDKLDKISTQTLSVATVKQDNIKSAKEDTLKEKPKTCVNKFGMDNGKIVL
jgi:hypothetical protein